MQSSSKVQAVVLLAVLLSAASQISSALIDGKLLFSLRHPYHLAPIITYLYSHLISTTFALICFKIFAALFIIVRLQSYSN